MKACFFANAPMDLIEKVEFYKNDIRILKDLGFDVKVSNKLRNIPLGCDIYFAWWASSGAKALIASKILRKPCFLVVGGSDVSLKDRSPAGYYKRNFLHKIIIKWNLRNADAILAISKDGFEDAALLGAKRMHLVYLSIDTEKYSPKTVKKQDIALIVSHLSKQNIERKGIKDVIKAMKIVTKRNPRAKLFIIGKKLEGYPEVLDLTKKLGLEKNVIFCGAVGEKEKINFYNISKVFVSPSEHEGFGVAMGEAMACGLPVIVTARGATPEVAGRAGIYVPLNDVESIAKAIIKVIENPNIRKDISKKSREQIMKFSLERRRDEIKKIMEPFIKKAH
jgi:glycosyltransferase involved in cell wall biosynthesis